MGILFDRGEEIFIAFGDTFSGADFMGNWRSNVLAVTTDRDASDGILFDRMISTKINRHAIELLHSRKQDNIEMTVIPTGGFSLGDTLSLCGRMAYKLPFRRGPCHTKFKDPGGTLWRGPHHS
ncbi:MAG: DUF4185 domain-containing protein [Treponema sp.]|nr:DUF4185 domain-containing protein [Treponema sp.]